MNKSQILDIIHDTCLQLGRPDLVGQIKFGMSKNYIFIPNIFGIVEAQCYGYVYANLVEKRFSKKIVFPKNLLDLSEESQIKCIKHEACHIVDLSQETESWTDGYGGHGPSFQKLAKILDIPIKVPPNEIKIRRSLSEFKNIFHAYRKLGFIYAK